MKRILKVVLVVAIIYGIFISGFFIRNLLLHREIERLENIVSTNEETIRQYAFANGDRTDEQSKTDIKFMQYVFNEIFTFYDLEDFKRAKKNATEYGLPESFVESFYDTSELSSSVYSEAMLDVMCKYESSDFYLLERSEGIGYYFGLIELNTVKYNTTFSIAVFVSIRDSGDETERIQSIVYYNID